MAKSVARAPTSCTARSKSSHTAKQNGLRTARAIAIMLILTRMSEAEEERWVG
ncbi:hypothetical protein ACWC9U_36475 [Streptomyces sp. 900116325]